MGLKDVTAPCSKRDLAHLGAGEVGYIRKISGDDVSRCFPEAPDLDPGIDLWALFGADGTPILLTDNRSSTFFKAAEDDLRTVSLH
ncbi:BQ00720 family protein [Ensifer soli]|uniref:BQ00720 family protein n=1 Tax=Ciceribacter sp. sgz301302 TaxID=3342379 RepID=UPI0035BA9305